MLSARVQNIDGPTDLSYAVDRALSGAGDSTNRFVVPLIGTPLASDDLHATVAGRPRLAHRGPGSPKLSQSSSGGGRERNTIPSFRYTPLALRSEYFGIL